MQLGSAVIEIFWPGTPKMTFWEKCIKYHIFYSKTNFLSLRMHLLHKTYTYTLQHVHSSTAWNDYFKFSSRGGSRTAATSKVKHLMIIVNRLKPLKASNKKLHLGSGSSPRSTSELDKCPVDMDFGGTCLTGIPLIVKWSQ